MPRLRLAIALAVRAGTFGAPEALVGDVLEEADLGRSRLWLWQQVLGLYWFALISRVRHPARPTPAAIALGMGATMLFAAAIASPRVVVAAWLTFYYVMGAASLFTQMAAHTIGADASGHLGTGAPAD